MICYIECIHVIEKVRRQKFCKNTLTSVETVYSKTRYFPKSSLEHVFVELVHRSQLHNIRIYRKNIVSLGTLLLDLVVTSDTNILNTLCLARIHNLINNLLTRRKQ